MSGAFSLPTSLEHPFHAVQALTPRATLAADVVQQTQEKGEEHMPEQDLLTVREIARQLRVDDTSVRRWIKIGALEALTLPHRGMRCTYRIRREPLDELLTTT